MAVLKALVIGMGVLIVAGIVAIAITIANRAGAPPSSPAERSVALPAGARVLETHVSEGRLVVRIALADGATRIALYDLDGRPVATLDFGAGEAVPPRP